MNFNRRTNKALGLASLAIISSIGLSACVFTNPDLYAEEYYPAEHHTVVVKHPAPVVQRVDVYEPRPSVIVAHPRWHRHPHHYYSSPRPIDPVVIHQRPYRHSDKTVILNPGTHQQQKVIVKGHPRNDEDNTTIIKNVHRPYNNETRVVSPTQDTEVKQPKKIVIESRG